MCGIVGYVGPRQVLPILLSGLSKLEYRGYDSAGVALLSDDRIKIFKKKGKIVNLITSLQDKDIRSTLGIGHTRWATHGGVSDSNAHPHTDCSGKIVLVHNGIFENYYEVKAELATLGHKFQSETDTEVLAHLIEHEYQKVVPLGLAPTLAHFEQAFRAALRQVEGGYSIVCFSQDHPEAILAGRMHNPLIIGIGQGENLVASDVPAILPYTKEVYNLQSGEVATIKSNSVKVTDLEGHAISFQTRTITWNAEQAEKGGYPHFLIKEIHETPNVLRQVLSGRIIDHHVEGATLGLDGLDLRKIRKVTLLGCGSAAYACLYGKYLFERWGRVTAEMFYGSEFRYHEPVIDGETLVIAVSQSGETADTLASIHKAKESHPARLVGIVNAHGSSMTREVDRICHLQAGPEISVASTKAFSSMITTLALMALYFAQTNNPGLAMQGFLDELSALPETLEKTLQLEDQIAQLSTFYIHKQSAYYIGRDVNYPCALEGTQKLKELSYIHAEAYPAGELKHGPNAVIHAGFPIVCLVPQGRVYKKMLSNIQEMRAREAHILAIAQAGDTQIAKHADHVIYQPASSEEISVMVSTLVMQLFAYYVTLYKGFSIDQPEGIQKVYPMPGHITSVPKSIDIDKPRNLAKSVTVE